MLKTKTRFFKQRKDGIVRRMRAQARRIIKEENDSVANVRLMMSLSRKRMNPSAMHAMLGNILLYKSLVRRMHEYLQMSDKQLYQKFVSDEFIVEMYNY